MSKFKFGDKVTHELWGLGVIVDSYFSTSKSIYFYNVSWRDLHGAQVGSGLPASELSPINDWIPCSERMPDFGVDVLITDGISCCVDSRVKRCFIDDSEWSLFKKDVTHWMPLPSPPTE